MYNEYGNFAKMQKFKLNYILINYILISFFYLTEITTEKAKIFILGTSSEYPIDIL